MKFEIDMLSVGNADAITIRYWGDDNQEVVILIDAGKREHGARIIRHIRNNTEQKKINLAICTHSDNDHIGGFKYLLDQEIEIDEFWMHDPENYREKLTKLLKEASNKGLTSLNESLKQALNLMKQINGNIDHKEPFTGLVYRKAPLTILAPTAQYYITRLKGFRDIKNLVEIQTILFEPKCVQLFESLKGKDPSNENNSSVITFFHPGKLKYLFTADADVSGLEVACDVKNLTDLNWLQVPHHGSYNNLNEDIVRHFNPRVAYISAAGIENKPHPDIVKLLKKTRAQIFTTEGVSLLHRYRTPKREGYGPAKPI